VPPDRTLVIQTAHLGDVVLTLPLIRRLAGRYGPVDLLTSAAAAELVSHHPAIHQVIPYDKHGAQRSVATFVALSARLRRTGYARAFLPHRSPRSALLALLAGIPERIGFGGRAPAISYTVRVPYPAEGHQVARLHALAEADGTSSTASPPGPGRKSEGEAHGPWLPLTESERRTAGAWLETAGVAQPFIVLAPGSRWGTKRWPYFADLAAALSDPIVVVGGPEDQGLAEMVVARDPERIRSAVGVLTIRGTAALLERAALLVTNDSLPLHLASALNRPAIAIFGPTITDFGFGPLSDRSEVVEHPEVSCRPCSPHGPMTCPRGHHRCMRDLPVAAVVAAMEGLRV
jgi:heptosyltransferase-2